MAITGRRQQVLDDAVAALKEEGIKAIGVQVRCWGTPLKPAVSRAMPLFCKRSAGWAFTVPLSAPLILYCYCGAAMTFRLHMRTAAICLMGCAGGCAEERGLRQVGAGSSRAAGPAGHPGQLRRRQLPGGHACTF